MIKIGDLSLFTILLFLAAVIVFDIVLNKVLRKAIKLLNIRDGELAILVTKVTLIIFYVLIMLVFQINIKKLLSFENFNTGVIWFLAGTGFSILISILTYGLVKNSTSKDDWGGLIKGSPFYMFLTLLVFVGPSEDLLFIGIIQYLLMIKLGWIAIPIYIIFFTLYHYFNVLNNAESKEQFLQMLPIRLIVSLILSMAFYTTKSLIYGFFIHNIFDTLCFLGILLGTKEHAKYETNI